MELETCGNSKKVQLWFWGPILKYGMYSTKESNGSRIKKAGKGYSPGRCQNPSCSSSFQQALAPLESPAAQLPSRPAEQRYNKFGLRLCLTGITKQPDLFRIGREASCGGDIDPTVSS